MVGESSEETTARSEPRIAVTDVTGITGQVRVTVTAKNESTLSSSRKVGEERDENDNGKGTVISK